MSEYNIKTQIRNWTCFYHRDLELFCKIYEKVFLSIFNPRLLLHLRMLRLHPRLLLRLRMLQAVPPSLLSLLLQARSPLFKLRLHPRLHLLLLYSLLSRPS